MVLGDFVGWFLKILKKYWSQIFSKTCFTSNCVIHNNNSKLIMDNVSFDASAAFLKISGLRNYRLKNTEFSHIHRTLTLSTNASCMRMMAHWTHTNVLNVFLAYGALQNALDVFNTTTNMALWNIMYFSWSSAEKLTSARTFAGGIPK